MGLPLGVIVALSSGSLLAGLAGMIAAVLVVLFVCRKDIISRNKAD
jgi:predicted PurR-regulated permease PerM